MQKAGIHKFLAMRRIHLEGTGHRFKVQKRSIRMKLLLQLNYIKQNILFDLPSGTEVCIRVRKC